MEKKKVALVLVMLVIVGVLVLSQAPVPTRAQEQAPAQTLTLAERINIIRVALARLALQVEALFPSTNTSTTQQVPNPIIPGITSSTGPGEALVGERVVFEWSGTSPKGDLLRWRITWGDGTIPSSGTCTDNICEHVRATHTWKNEGIHTITANVFDRRGNASEELGRPIRITARPESSGANISRIGGNDSAPRITSIIVPDGVTAGAEADFVFEAEDLDRDNLRWTVDWGDDATNDTGACPSPRSNNSFTPSHLWKTAGIYNVTVIVSDCGGKQTTSNLVISVTK